MRDEVSFALSRIVSVYHSPDFVVTDGVAVGGALLFADHLIPDDIYTLPAGVSSQPLTLIANTDIGGFSVAYNTQTGVPGHTVHLDCCITLMTPNATTVEALVLVAEVGQDVTAIYLLPLGDIVAEAEYRLIDINRNVPTTRLADAARPADDVDLNRLVSYAGGAHLTAEAQKKQRRSASR